MAMKRQNSQGIRMLGSSDVFDDTDLLEEILVRVPHESIFNSILVSKRWFDLICGSCFREHYIRRWSDEVKSMQSAEACEHYVRRWRNDVNLLRLDPSAEAGELRQQLESQQLAALNQLQHRLQSQQLAAFDQLQHRLVANRLYGLSLADLILSLGRLHSERVAVVDKFHHKIELAAENLSETRVDGSVWNAMDESVKLSSVNESQQQRQARVLRVVKRLLQALPGQRWAVVNEVQHQIVCELLVVANEVQWRQYWEMILKPLTRCSMNLYQQHLISARTD